MFLQFLFFFSQKLLIFPLGHNSENCTFSVKKRNEKSKQSTPPVRQMHISSHVALFLLHTFGTEDFPLWYYVQNKFNGETPNYSTTSLNWSGVWGFFWSQPDFKKKLRWNWNGMPRLPMPSLYPPLTHRWECAVASRASSGSSRRIITCSLRTARKGGREPAEEDASTGPEGLSLSAVICQVAMARWSPRV